MRTTGSGSGRRWWNGTAAWALATVRQRATLVCGGVVLVVCLLLLSLDRAALPVVLAALAVDAVLLARVRSELRRRCREDRRICEEAARGQLELERWLAFGERA